MEHVYVRQSKENNLLIFYSKFIGNLPYLVESVYDSAYTINADIITNKDANLNANMDANSDTNMDANLNVNMDANLNANADANSNTNMDANSNANMDANSNANMDANLNMDTNSKPRFIYWHEVFGYVNLGFNKRNYYKDGHTLPNLMKYKCEAYSLSKLVHHLPKASIYYAKQPLEHVYSDLSEISPVSSLGESYYYLTLINKYTRFSWIYFLEEKSHAVKAIKDFIIMIEK